METVSISQTNRIGKRGTWVVPASLRQRYGFEEGALVIAEPRPDGILLKAAIVLPALTASSAQTSVWDEWFGLMNQINATTEEITDALAEGRR